MDDAKHTVAIFGTDLDYLDGKTVEKRAHHMLTFLPITMSSYVMKNHRIDILCTENCHVNGNVFFTP